MLYAYKNTIDCGLLQILAIKLDLEILEEFPDLDVFHQQH
jgi:hypothetical protein